MITRDQIETCLRAFHAGATLKDAAAAAGIGTISARRAIRGQLPLQVAGHHANLGRTLPRHPNAVRAEAAPHIAPAEIAAMAKAIRDAWSPATALARRRAADRALLRLARTILSAHAAHRAAESDPAPADEPRSMLTAPATLAQG